MGLLNHIEFWDFIGPVLATVATILALFGNPYNENESGIKRLSKIGYIIAGLAILGFVVTLKGISDNNEKSSTTIEMIKGEFDAVKNQNDNLLKNDSIDQLTNDSLNIEIKELNAAINPFVKLASKNYPNMDSSLALGLLAHELKQVKEIATKDIYKPYSSNKKGLIEKSLKQVGAKHKDKPILRFLVQINTENNDKVLGELKKLLINAGFQADIEYGLYPSASNNPWEIHILTKDAHLMSDILEAIKPYINPRYGVAQRDLKQWVDSRGKFPSGEINIFVNTSPDFSSSGQIKY